MDASAQTPRMSVEEYLAWSEGREGRHELVDGHVVAMAPEKAGHVRAKLAAALALQRAIRAAGLPCEAFADGLGVRLGDDTLFEPDALVRCGPRLPDDVRTTDDPVVVVEVLSPSTAHRDTGPKLEGYFSLASLGHYLVLDPDRRRGIHYRRAAGPGRPILVRLLAPGDRLRLDPPGLELVLGDLFEAT